MISSKIIFFLMFLNMVVAFACLFEGNYTKAVYWLGASLINFSVAIMK